MDTFRPSLEEGFARSADTPRSESDITPIVNVCIDDDLEAARDEMRPQLALYLGGMGSRDKNFCNRLACAYGFEAAASEIQALYLAGRKQDAAAALPGELIDAVCRRSARPGSPSACELPRRGRRHPDRLADGRHRADAPRSASPAGGSGLLTVTGAPCEGRHRAESPRR
jgi:hypothetical protein